MSTNIASRIELQAQERPQKIALYYPGKQKVHGGFEYQALTFQAFNQRASAFAHGLNEYGIKKGERVLLFVRPSLDFPALVFALFKIGAIPVLIDPGMGKKNLLQAIKDVKPRVLIAEPIVHLMRLAYPKAFKSIELFFTTKFFGGIKLQSLANNTHHFSAVKVESEDLAAILFTSGGTGAPKGVEYTHDIFNAQTDRLQEMFKLTPSDIDVPGFPLFAFFTLSMGMTSVTPKMDPSRPAKCDPAKIVASILDHQASFVAGSPAIWERVADYCLKEQIKLPSVKSVVMFGAPVRYELHEKFEQILPHGTTYTPYGATECLPVANVSGKDVLRFGREGARQGKGTFLGAAAPKTQIAIIKVSDEIIADLKEAQILGPYEIGEIIVKADVATRAYFESEAATKLAKIKNGESFWHRMGDLGYLDSAGHLWFLGRKTHRITQGERMVASISFESVFNHHLGLKRCALIGVGPENELGLVIESAPSSELQQKVFSLAKQFEHTRELKYVFFKENFPLDVRHNIKIDRTRLGREINRELAK